MSPLLARLMRERAERQARRAGRRRAAELLVIVLGLLSAVALAAYSVVQVAS